MSYDIDNPALRSKEEVIDEWLTSIGLTREKVVMEAYGSLFLTEFAAAHMCHGEPTQADQLTHEGIRANINRELDKLGIPRKK